MYSINAPTVLLTALTSSFQLFRLSIS